MSLWVVVNRYSFYTVHVVSKPEPVKYRNAAWKNPKAWIYHIWAEIDSFLHEQFDPRWRELLPPLPCQFCGRTDHKTKFCPNAKDLGF